jgi:hypothetical protein
MLRRLEPGARVFSVVADRWSRAISHHRLFLHYPVWYQVERVGEWWVYLAEEVPPILPSDRGESAGR